MSSHIQLSYFYGKEADQFTFYKIPKLLFTDPYFKDLSVDAKVLYGLMLDRVALSVKNQWIDAQGRAFIYFSIEEAMEMLGCRNNKVLTILKELDKGTGIGLIERQRQGQGKPTLIYVMQFLVRDIQKCDFPTSEENEPVPEMGNLKVKTFKKPMSRSGDFKCLDIGKSHSNKTNINNTEYSETESNLISSDQMGFDTKKYARIIRENIALDDLLIRFEHDRNLINGIYDLILEMVLCQSEHITIASGSYPAEIVRSRFLKLNFSHIEYVVTCLKQNTTKVRNIRKYLLAALYNAPATMDGYYTAEVNHDFPEFVVQAK